MRKRVFSTSSGALIAFVDTLGETSIFWTFSNPVSKTVSLLFHFSLKKSICNFSTVSLSSYGMLRFMMKSIIILNRIFLTVVTRQRFVSAWSARLAPGRQIQPERWERKHREGIPAASLRAEGLRRNLGRASASPPPAPRSILQARSQNVLR